MLLQIANRGMDGSLVPGSEFFGIGFKEAINELLFMGKLVIVVSDFKIGFTVVVALCL